MQEKQVRDLLVPLLKRSTDSQKYTFGHILVIGGSPGMVGAPVMAAWAALRTGAGMVTIASTLTEAMQGRILEVMTLSLPHNSTYSADLITNFVEQRSVSVLVIGPGLTATSAPLVAQLVSKLNLPIVLDAGGFDAFSGNLAALQAAAQHNSQLILTPHGGEYQRLSGEVLPADFTALKQQVTAFAQRHGVTMLLKGHRTIVAGADGKVYENQTGNPGLATAGTGDVLAGMIGALCGQGLSAYEAACGGTYLHGLAGDIAVHSMTEPGLTATDVIKRIPIALHALINS
jgi:hydroxyethylthiazole kinase-like uncharacterized protein yjeF